MDDLPLKPGERLLAKSPDIFVKSSRFRTTLTTRRLILSAASDPALPARDLPIESIEALEAGENGQGEPILGVVASTPLGESRRMILAFPAKRGISRENERDRWMRWIEENGKLALGRTPAPAAESPEPGSRENGPGSGDRGIRPPPAIRVPGRSEPRTLGNFIGSYPPVNPSPAKAREREIVLRDTSPPPRILENPGAPSAAPPVPGSPDGQDPVFCVICGNRVPGGAFFCNQCGATVIYPEGRAGCRKWGDVELPGETASLALQWGVPVAPPRQAPGARASPPAWFGRDHPARYASPDGYPAGSGPEPLQKKFGFGPVGNRLAVIAVLVVFAGVLFAAAGGFFGGVLGMYGTTPDDTGGGVPDTILTGTAAEDIPADESTGDIVSPVSESTLTASAKTQGTSASSEGSAVTTADEDIPSTGVYLKVESSGSWDGSYGSAPAIWAVSGEGDRIYSVADASGTVSATFQGDDDSGSDLVLALYKDGQVVSSKKAAGSGGTVTLQASV